MSGKGTPATQAAAKAGVAHTVHEYSHDAGAAYGLEAANALGIDPRRVHKTLLASVEGLDGMSLVVAIVPVSAQLDLKALASAIGAKRAEMAAAAAAERATGYVVGGISPLGQRKRLPTVIDAGALDHDTVFVSAGRRGLEIELAPSDLVRVTAASIAAIARAG